MLDMLLILLFPIFMAPILGEILGVVLGAVIVVCIAAYKLIKKALKF
jgi:hypothetical protein